MGSTVNVGSGDDVAAAVAVGPVDPLAAGDDVVDKDCVPLDGAGEHAASKMAPTSRARDTGVSAHLPRWHRAADLREPHR